MHRTCRQDIRRETDSATHSFKHMTCFARHPAFQSAAAVLAIPSSSPPPPPTHTHHELHHHVGVPVSIKVELWLEGITQGQDCQVTCPSCILCIIIPPHLQAQWTTRCWLRFIPDWYCPWQACCHVKLGGQFGSGGVVLRQSAMTWRQVKPLPPKTTCMTLPAPHTSCHTHPAPPCHTQYLMHVTLLTTRYMFRPSMVCTVAFATHCKAPVLGLGSLHRQ
jgi:hypothetical protein